MLNSPVWVRGLGGSAQPKNAARLTVRGGSKSQSQFLHKLYFILNHRLTRKIRVAANAPKPDWSQKAMFGLDTLGTGAPVFQKEFQFCEEIPVGKSIMASFVHTRPKFSRHPNADQGR